MGQHILMGWSNGSLYFSCGFEAQSVEQLRTLTGTAANFTIDTTNFNSGAASMKFSKAAGDNQFHCRGLLALPNIPCRAMTFALRVVTPPVNNGGIGIMTLSYIFGGTHLGEAFGIYSDGSGNTKPHILQHNNVAAWTGTTTLADNTWYYFQTIMWIERSQWQTMLVVRNSSGTELERSPVVSVAHSVPVSNISGFGFGAICKSGSASLNDALEYQVDDIAVVLGGVFAPNTVKHKVMRGNANGTDTGWTGNGGGGGGGDYDDYNDAAPDDDTSYISATGNATETCTDSTWADPTAGAEEFFAVNIWGRMKRSSGTGNRLIQCYIREGGTNDNGSGLSVVASNSYVYVWWLHPRLPSSGINVDVGVGIGGDSGSPWTSATIGAIEFGVIVGVLSGTATVRCTQAVAEVCYGVEWSDTFGGNPTMRETNTTTTTRRVLDMRSEIQ